MASQEPDAPCVQQHYEGLAVLDFWDATMQCDVEVDARNDAHVGLFAEATGLPRGPAVEL